MPKKLSIGTFGPKRKIVEDVHDNELPDKVSTPAKRIRPYEDDEYPVKVERKLTLCLTPDQRDFLLWGMGYLRGRSFGMDVLNQRYVAKHTKALMNKLTH